jgi:nucleoside-diphosphate-sugar epimerase
MRILVTGSEGYIGTLLLPILLQKGHDVVGLDTGYYREGRLYQHEAGKAPPCINKDLRNVSEKDLLGFDAVVHLAELSNDPLSELNPETTYRINHLGSVQLAHSCKSAGVKRFVYTSSCSVYGTASIDYVTEESDTNPQTTYARCKILVERDVSAMADDHFTPTFLRNATAFGPSPAMRFDLVLNNLAGCAWTTREISMTSDGTPWRPLVHVLDICRAIALVLDSPRQIVHNQIFNVGATSENYQVRQIAEIISKTFSNCHLTFGAAGGDTRSYRVSFEKIRCSLPAFQCEWTVAAGAQQLLQSFRKIDLTADVFRYRFYTRLHQLMHLLRTRQVDDDLFWSRS